MMQIQRTIKYEADRVPGFGREVKSVPGCEQLVTASVEASASFGEQVLPLRAGRLFDSQETVTAL